MARVLKVSASGYYAWRSRPASARATADADLTRRIRTIHAGSHGTYGAPRVTPTKAEGVQVGRKRVARLMRVAGIAGRQPAQNTAPVTTRQAPDHRAANDLARRNFIAERPNDLGRRRHVHSDVGRLSLSRGRPRRLVAPDRRMGLLGRSEDAGRA